MNETDIADIQMNSDQAGHVVRLLRAEVVETRHLGNRLINLNQMIQAGMNCHDTADELEALANLIDATFPEVDDEG